MPAEETAMANENGKSPEDQLGQLQTWIGTILSSKKSKNITRDFSDGVLMAEVLKVYYPRYVDLRNYVSACNLTTKKENWNILNRKVLGKIDMKLSKDTVSQLANSHPGAAEHLLLELRNKLLKDPEHNAPLNIKEKNSEEEGKKNVASVVERHSNSDSTDRLASNTFDTNKSTISRVKRRLSGVLQWLLAWLCFWAYFPSMKFRSSRNGNADATRTQDTSQNTNPENVIPRDVCVQLKQEVLEKDNIISTLNCKVAYLENAMKVKDLRISSLATRILQSAVKSEQIARSQANATLSKACPRPLNLREKVKVAE